MTRADAAADPRDRGLRALLERLGDPEEVCRLPSGPGSGAAGACLAKSPRAVYEVLVAKEGLFENPPHPYRRLDGSYRTTGAALLGLKARDSSRGAARRDLHEAATAFLETSPPIEEGEFDVVAQLKPWAARLIAVLLWGGCQWGGCQDEQAAATSAFAREVAAMEREGNVALDGLASRGPFLACLADSTAIQARDPGLEDPAAQHALLRTFLNGYNAVAVGLSWCLLRLAQEPALQHRVRRGEVEALDFVQEILRLYSPAWVFRRVLLQDEVVAGMPLRAGTVVLVSPLITQRDPLYWRNADRLIPERDRRSEPRELRFFPFGGGERICPAVREAPELLARILRFILRDLRLETVDLQGDASTGDPDAGVPWIGRISLHPPPGTRIRAIRDPAI